MTEELVKLPCDCGAVLTFAKARPASAPLVCGHCGKNHGAEVVDEKKAPKKKD